MKAKTEIKEMEPIQRIPETLHGAIVNVMNEVKNIDKNLTVGDGKASYKGVADKDVKFIIGQAMAKNGLTCLPIDIQPTVKIDRWTETTNYGEKSKQSIFTEVIVKYRLTHIFTNESIDIVGYGHGVDSQDKSSGKATTYALKNALLYSFMVPTGAIDDTDKTHSNDIQTPITNQKIKLNDNQFIRGLKAIQNGDITKENLINEYDLTETQLNTLNNLE
jgi:hypothetical protein